MNMRQDRRAGELGALGRWLRLLILLAWSLMLVACGSAVPTPIVKQALTYRTTHPLTRPPVGHEQLLQQTEVRQVQVRRDRSQDYPLLDGTSLPGHDLQGTYTLTVYPPQQNPYSRSRLPFRITLATSAETESTWILLEPVPRISPQQWRPVAFLPPPPPEPEEPAPAAASDQERQETTAEATREDQQSSEVAPQSSPVVTEATEVLPTPATPTME